MRCAVSSELDRPDLADLYLHVLDNDQSSMVMATGLQGLFKVNPTGALERAKTFEDSDSETLLTGVAGLYAAAGETGRLSFFEKNLGKVDNRAAGEFAGAYLGLAFQDGPESLKEAISTLGTKAQDQSTSVWKRFGYTNALAELKQVATSEEAAAQPGMTAVATQLTTVIDAIKVAETNPQLKAMFSQM